MERRQLIEVLNLDTVVKNGQGGHEALNEAMNEKDRFDSIEKEKVELCQEKRWGEEVELEENPTVKDSEVSEGAVFEEEEVWVSPLESILNNESHYGRVLFSTVTCCWP